MSYSLSWILLCNCLFAHQETGNSDAVLSREEIQAVINKANAQTKDAIACELTTDMHTRARTHRVT